jgi:predicted nucleic acid-binding protein
VKVALDTNVLVYAERVNGEARAIVVHGLLAAMSADAVVLPVQALAELFTVLTRKAGRSAESARGAVMGWRDAYATSPTTDAVFVAALDLSASHHLSMWDAIMLSAAAQADCRLLLTEDLQSGFTWRGVTVVDPFAEQRHPLLAALTD